MRPITLQQIQDKLATETSPITLAEYRVTLSHKYGVATDNQEACETLFVDWWGEHRDEYKSDASCERAFDKTEAGKQRRHWNLQRKKIDRMLSAIKSLIDARNTEYFNSNRQT